MPGDIVVTIVPPMEEIIASAKEYAHELFGDWVVTEEVGKWHLKENAPDDLKKKFKETFANSDYERTGVMTKQEFISIKQQQGFPDSVIRKSVAYVESIIAKMTLAQIQSKESDQSFFWNGESDRLGSYYTPPYDILA